MKIRDVQSLLCSLLLAVFVATAPVSAAADDQNYQLVDGIAVYLGIVPAEVILGHSPAHAESEMHGGVPRGRHRDHLVIALFEGASGQRISDARVTATVAEIGLAGETKSLDPMQIAGTTTYGNYFEMASRGVYRVRVQIRRPGNVGVVKAEFTHRHT